jgi:hypothetical protein
MFCLSWLSAGASGASLPKKGTSALVHFTLTCVCVHAQACECVDTCVRASVIVWRESKWIGMGVWAGARGCTTSHALVCVCLRRRACGIGSRTPGFYMMPSNGFLLESTATSGSQPAVSSLLHRRNVSCAGSSCLGRVLWGSCEDY